jgi:L-asparaginase
MKNILVITTGGTIAMKYDAVNKTFVPATSGQELLDSVPAIKKFAKIKLVEFSNIDSSEMTPDMMFRLTGTIQKYISQIEVDGIVITHGTDTLEETAYMIDLLVDSEKPIVLTAAMRGFDEIGTDVPINLLAAVKAACSAACRNLGTLVIMNDEIHAAREVIKTYTSNVATLESPGYGPLGIIDLDNVIIHRKSIIRETIKTAQIETNVALFRMSAGDDGASIKHALENNVKGFVVEGLGRGNLPPQTAEKVLQAIKGGIPVVLTSRCFKGRVLGLYAGTGGGKKLHDAGIIYGGDLSGQKARIKLMCVLGETSDMLEIKRMFEGGMYG